MKKLICVMLTVLLTLSLFAGCSAPETAGGKNTYNLKTVKDGYLTVITSPDYAPYEFYAIGADGKAELAGFDIALIKYIADYLKLELEIIPMDFDGVLMEVATGKVDMGLAGLSPDPARMDAMDFSDIYYEGGQSFVTVTANKDMFKSLDDTNKAEVSVRAQTASIQMDLANEYSADTDIIPLPKVTDIIAELISGKLDGAYIETAVAEAYKLNYPELEIVLDVPYDTEGSAAGIVKGNEALLNAVNEAIAAAIADGSMDKFVADAGEQASGKTGILVDGEIVIDG